MRNFLTILVVIGVEAYCRMEAWLACWGDRWEGEVSGLRRPMGGQGDGTGLTDGRAGWRDWGDRWEGRVMGLGTPMGGHGDGTGVTDGRAG